MAIVSLKHINHYQTRINQFLAQKLAEQTMSDKKLYQAMEYGLLIGGKRMRPYLAYITGESLKVPLSDIDVIAASIECIHAYSLLHDDLPAMDDDNLRRGKPTCHIAFDEATAILAGDALQTLAFDILANHPLTDYANTKRINLIQQLVKAAGFQGMCGGQALDLAATNKNINLAQLEHIHKLKTGALLQASVLMVAECTENLKAKDSDNLQEFAQCIGLAYQVRDDIIDITSSEQELGKPAGSDLAANKSTYPALLGLEGAQQKADQLYQQALQALANLPYNSDNLISFANFIVNRKN